MKAWWGRLSLRARLAFGFASLAAGAQIFLLALIARSAGLHVITQGKIIPASVFVLIVFIAGGWFVAGWCLTEISRVGAMTDESQQAPLELEGLRSLIRREALRRDRLMNELRQFTADVSHEIRRPVTALRATGELALRRSISEGNHHLPEAMGAMLEEAEGLERLLSRLLELSRLESGQVPFNPASFLAIEFLRECRESLLALAVDRRISILVGSPEGLILQTDRMLLRVAVLNLLHNAIVWSPEGGEIRLHARSDDQGGRLIDVVDQGPGIPQVEREHLFQRFHRGAKTVLDNAPAGSGLGLAIALRSMERAGGTIALGDGPGQGCAFEIVLPASAT